MKKIIPDVIRDQIILSTHKFPDFYDMKEYIKEKARALVVAKSAKNSSSAVNMVIDEEFTDEIMEMSLGDAIAALGDPPTEVILALVQKRQQWRNDKGKRPFRKKIHAPQKRDGKPKHHRNAPIAAEKVMTKTAAGSPKSSSANVLAFCAASSDTSRECAPRGRQTRTS